MPDSNLVEKSLAHLVQGWEIVEMFCPREAKIQVSMQTDSEVKSGNFSEPTSPQSTTFSGEGFPAAALHTFAQYSKVVFGVAIFVILLGAFVRSSLSGDGCGTSWPLCGGTLLPKSSLLKTYIELSHRVTAGGIFGLMVLAAYVWTIRNFPKGSLLRKSTGLSLIFTLVSAFIGAVLVKQSWVVYDKSVWRMVVMSLHLMNNFFLLGSLIMTVFWASGGHRVTWKNQGITATALKAAMAGMFLMGITGAISAMGKTAYSLELSGVTALSQRIAMHLGPDAPAILKGGVLHPLITTSVGLLILWLCGVIVHERDHSSVRKWARVVVGLYCAQMVVGVVNLAISAPSWLQIIHLFLAVLDWSALIVLSAHALDVKFAASPEPQEVFPSQPLGVKIKAYVALTKPRIISLLLFTTLAAMFIAKGGVPSLGLIAVVMVGGYLAAGSANAFNQVIETDLDLAMERTSHRPIVSHLLTKGEAVTFAYATAVISFGLLTWGANLLSATMALAGLLCYVFVYTLWLKRRTWQNIVIGGAAGAFPPLVGFAAIRGELNPLAWFLFALIFTWTPVHFWALALLIKDDYAKAGVPMLPVVKGDRVTVIQIMLYAVITAVMPVVPLMIGVAGPVFLIGSTVLNLGLLAQSLQLLRNTNRDHARSLFKYSMVYLALIFIVIAIDRLGTVTA